MRTIYVISESQLEEINHSRREKEVENFDASQKNPRQVIRAMKITFANALEEQPQKKMVVVNVAS